ncbi:DUF6248 family natural product biosynthesis protein [Streptosporangium roseum]|uniref:DUF6248 family natural product biosynthesis protein n=1 Tax=Streptosporangium roseum TaxID=2001 RepID=UPI0004CD0124|nr:DUF6248 family natural product biosynthesis protein [Streptosporangium roseum]
MTPDQAAWVREHAWPKAMLKAHNEHPGATSHCACQWGGGSCLSAWKPRHDTCHIGVPLPVCETYIVTRTGGVAGFAEPYRHPSVSATGWHRVATAMVWLADRLCAWACPCDCGHLGPAPAHAMRPAPPPAPEFTADGLELVMLPGLEQLHLAGVC